MTLRLHNTLTRSTDDFVPQNDTRVSLYTCGPTVYNFLHVGNWAAYIYWDVLIRTLRASGYTTERVMNITDVGHLTSDEDEGEDKLQKGARRENKTAWDVAQFYMDDFLHGMERLDLLAPEHITRATDFIPQQLELVARLKAGGYTYQIDDGIYFDTSRFLTYADFARLNLDAQKAGARVEYNTEKRQSSDFALWKFSSPDEHRDMEWDTPSELLDTNESKKGFPGWHLECSAMAMSILGNTLDIHTGGIDHIPVHHTNEIAQSEAASGVRFSNYWLHNDHLKVNGTKIAKSLGNGYTLDQLEERGYSLQTFKLFVLQTHYRSEGNFTFDNLTAAQNRLHHWKNIAALRWQIHDTLKSDAARRDRESTIRLSVIPGLIREALHDDLNTSQALTVIDEAFSRLDTVNINTIDAHSLGGLLEHIRDYLGIDLLTTTPDISDQAKRIILERERARERKDWEASDRLRHVLVEDYALSIRDTAHGTVWEYQ